MAITRTAEWRLTHPPAEADRWLRWALGRMDMDPEGPFGQIRAKSSMSVWKNRWAAEVLIQLHPWGPVSVAVIRVEMAAGNKHYAVLNDIVEAAGRLIDDRGVVATIERMGGQGFGGAELRHLQNVLRGSEQVIALGKGRYRDAYGLTVLTNERLFFFDKGLLHESVDEFPLESITSLGTDKGLTGESLIISSLGNRDEIEELWHGETDEFVRQFRQLNAARARQQHEHHEHHEHEEPEPSGNQALEQLEQLASLRDRGVVTPQEFEWKKAELLRRI